MKVTGWAYYEAPDYEPIWRLGQGDSCPYSDEELRNAVVRELRERGYRFDGGYHQNGDYGAPIIDGKWQVLYSQREWGDIMAEALQLDNSDGDAYVVWAWIAPPEEDIFLPSPEDYKED